VKPSRLFFGELFYDPNSGLYDIVIKDQLKLQSSNATVTGSVVFDAERYISGTIQAGAAGITGIVQNGKYLSGTLQAQIAGIVGNITNVSSGPVSIGRVVIKIN